LISDIPAGDGKTANSFLQCNDNFFLSREHEKNGFRVPLRDEFDPEGSLADTEADSEIIGIVIPSTTLAICYALLSPPPTNYGYITLHSMVIMH
jgi:hypothetical protein